MGWTFCISIESMETVFCYTVQVINPSCKVHTPLHCCQTSDIIFSLPNSILLDSTTKQTPLIKSLKKPAAMKVVTFLFAIGIVPLAMAERRYPPPRQNHADGGPSTQNWIPRLSSGPLNQFVPFPPVSSGKDNNITENLKNALGPRGVADNTRTKKECDSMFKSDKTPYVLACAGEPDQDSMNLCELGALVGDASVECRAALMKTMGF
jgi:hypothetical protein